MIPTRNGTRKSTWIQAGLVMLVLLLVPIAALLLFPSPTPPPREAESEKPRMLPASSASRVELPAVTKPDVKALSSAKDPVRGRVLDGDGKGIAGASVRCEGEEPAAATSVEDGRFELPLGVDGCDAKASHPDYGVSELVHLTIGGAGVLVLPMPGSIVGNVVDERGLPVSAFLIAVESFTAPGQQPDLEGRPHKSISDPSGGFELPRLSRGRYILTASAEGRPPTRSESVLVEPGNVTRGVRIKLLRGIALSGIVTDKETKRPLASVGVALDGMTNTGANAIDPATTGADGAYSLDGAPKGTFSVRFLDE